MNRTDAHPHTQKKDIKNKEKLLYVFEALLPFVLFKHDYKGQIQISKLRRHESSNKTPFDHDDENNTTISWYAKCQRMLHVYMTAARLKVVEMYGAQMVHVPRFNLWYEPNVMTEFPCQRFHKVWLVWRLIVVYENIFDIVKFQSEFSVQITLKRKSVRQPSKTLYYKTVKLRSEFSELITGWFITCWNGLCQILHQWE